LLQPGKLIAVKLVRGRIVESDEVDAAALPMVVGVEAMVLRIVAEALLLEFRGLEPVGDWMR
jgi:hypothetical protein